MDIQNKTVLGVLVCVIASMILCGLFLDGADALQGLMSIQTSPAKLINDFCAAHGVGAALINAALVGAAGLILILMNKVHLGGPTFSAVLTLIGFGLFGKNIVNILPIFFGVYLSAKFVGKRLEEYILIALFGSALGPLVSFLAFELGFSTLFSIALGILGGTAIGFILPAVSVAMLHFHQGYNLYNVGLSGGFLGLFIAAVVRASGKTAQTDFLWYDEQSILLIALVPVISIFLILSGLLIGKTKSISSLLAIQSHTGRLPSDFMDKETMYGTFLNCGLVGLIASAYVYFVGADFNGPVIGGLLTVIGFSAFGTHLKNSYPVVCGVIIASLVFSQPLNSPAAILAAIFCTTLAPIAGGFGVKIGIIAGFIHLTMVLQTGDWHGGFNLYNNGFAGGLTATLIVSVISWYDSNKSNDE